MRSEDINARQVQQAFADGATLAELEQHIAYLRSLGAPDDAHPKAGVNEDYEITVMICVVQRATPQAASLSSLSPATRPGLRAGPADRTVSSRVRRHPFGSRCPGCGGGDGPGTGRRCPNRRPEDAKISRPEHSTRTIRPLIVHIPPLGCRTMQPTR